jgi:hypothetical protein
MSSENWKDWVTEQRREYSARLKSAHLIRENESLSTQQWGTATVSRGGHRQKDGSVIPKLDQQVKNWPTSSSRDHKDTPGMSKERDGRSLGRIDQLPRAVYYHTQQDQESSNTTGSRRELWTTIRTPTGGRESKESKDKRGAGGVCLATQAKGKLNPRWVETLMGLPIGWTMPSCTQPATIELTNCDYSVTESCQTPPNERGEYCQSDLKKEGIEMSNHPPIYTMTFEELEERVKRGETIVTSCGYLVHSKDRKLSMRQRWDLWQKDCLAADARGDTKLRRDGGMFCQPNKPKEATVTDTRPLNAKGRPFSWSFSALNNFEGCPKRYSHEKFHCDVPYVQNEAAKWGDRVHKAAENFVKGLPVTDPDAFKEVQKYATVFKAQKDGGAEVIPELQIVLDQNMKPLTGKDAWYSKKAWFRIMIDVPIIRSTAANVFDYKTGGKSAKDDTEQLELCCAALGIIRPEIDTFTGKLVWTKHDTVSAGCSLGRSDLDKVWQGILPRVQRMEDAWRSGKFPARPSGLCRWKGGPENGGGQCPAYDKCEYHG